MSRGRNLSGCQVFQPSELPADWDCVQLQDRLELLYGRALKEEIRKPGDVDVFGSNGKVGSHIEHWLDAPGVLVGRKGTVGAVHYATNPFWPIDTTYYVRAKGEDDFRYLFYLLDYLPLKILNAATGVPGLSRRDAYALLGAFPPPKEQAAIARVLDAVDAAIGRAQGALDAACSVQASVVQSLVTTCASMSKSHALGDLILEGPTNGLYRPESDYGAKGTPIVRIDSFANGSITNLAGLRRVVVPSVIRERFALEQGDVLINRVNALTHVGKAAVVPELSEPTLFESNMMRLRCAETLVPEYLGVILRSDIARRHWLARSKPAVNQVSVNQRDTKSLCLPLPDPDRQREIAQAVKVADALVLRCQERISCLQSLKKSLMHDLLTGTVRVGPAILQEQQA